MADQETGNVAVLAIHASSPDTVGYLDLMSKHGMKTSCSGEDIGMIAGDKRNKHMDGVSNFKEKMHNQRNEINDKMAGLNKDVVDDLADIFISDEVLKQLQSQTDSDRKSTKPRRKAGKSQRKAVKMSATETKDETEIGHKGHAKKTPKSALRRKNSLLHTKPHGSRFEETGNKSEHNNWMVDDEGATDIHNSVVRPSFHSKGNSSYLDTIMEPSNTLAEMCSTKNCQSLNCQVMLEPVTKKEYPFTRADSSDDSGCFSNLSLQSIHSPGEENGEADMEGVPESKGKSSTQEPCPSSAALCSACGNERQGNGSGLCKTCIGRIKNEGIRSGALSELKAYAQSIAHSVKKILSISPSHGKEVLHRASSRDGGESKRGELKVEDGNVPHSSGAQVSKVKKQISMNYSEDSRSKGFQNKSVSFDGRAAHLEESSRASPMYWITQGKSKLSSVAPSELDEDKLRRVKGNTSDLSLVDTEYFSVSGKETKYYTGHDDDKNKVETVEKVKKKSYMKQLSCVERIRTEGDSRTGSLQQILLERKSVKEEKKTGELQRTKSRIQRPANVGAVNFKKQQKQAEEMNALNVFRLKVIHEGSPVDPLYTVQKGKSEDYKDRRAMFMRSATAPNKNHMPKKDSSMDDRSSLVRNIDKVKRSVTKVPVKVNRSPTPTKEEEEDEDEDVVETVQEKPLTVYESQLDSWRDDTMLGTAYSRRRSTSYDSSKAVSSKRGQLHRSISRSAVDRKEKGNKQRRKPPSKDKASVKKRENVYVTKGWQPLRFPFRSADENQPEMPSSAQSTFKRELISDSARYNALEYPRKEFPHCSVSRTSVDDERLGEVESPEKSSYFGTVSYGTLKEVPFSPSSNQPKAIRDADSETFVTEGYYCDTEQQGMDMIVSDKLLRSDSGVGSIFNGDDGGERYHDQIQKYNLADVSPEKDGLWYSSHSEKRALMARDRSHESKSSTSFHIVTTVRSSISDVALMKHQGNWDHGGIRRQSMYSETDVDTGLIYHFAKRQTTRAHMPAYHDLTSASKDIYTMSGDVSTSASSNSAISTKSEVSECVYTGGFYKHDPFYDNDSKVSSSSSSADSTSQLYFEPDNCTKREPSELDIYTGAIFSSSQNAISLGRAVETQPYALKDGSTNNSTRPMSRVSRRLRHRPRIDLVKFKPVDCGGEYLSSFEPNHDIVLCNISNNSCTVCNMGCVDDDDDDGGSRGAVVSTCSSSQYTDYDPGSRPVFYVKKVEKPAPVVDLLKYEKQVSPNSNSFFRTPTAEVDDGDNQWYNGFSRHVIEETTKKFSSVAQSPKPCTFAWQQEDEYYTSMQRPRFDKTNNCSCLTPDQSAYDTNNNRFEDMYTDFFDSSHSKNYVPEQSSHRPARSDSWYADQPKRNYSSFYDPDQPLPESARRSPVVNYVSMEGAYTSATIFGQKTVYSGSSPYKSQNSWAEYERSQIPTNNSYNDDPDDDESPKFRSSTPDGYGTREKYNYFPYADSQNPAEGCYMYETENYAFEPRIPSSEPDINEIKKVGGIVCRENVANKEDYAEDVNRDLEQGTWIPYNFRHEEKTRHQEEPTTSRSEPMAEIHRASVPTTQEKSTRHFDESSYSQNRVYDNMGARNKWREMANKKEAPSPQPAEPVERKEQSPHRPYSAGDAKKPEFVKTGVWNPPDQIPDKARGKRTALTTVPKPAVTDSAKGTSGSSSPNVISRVSNYFKKWF